MILRILSLFFIASFLLACDRIPKLGPATEDQLATASQSDCGFVQNSYGQRVSWKSKLPVRVFIDPSFPAEYESVLRAAASRWEAVVGRTLFTFEWSSGSSSPKQDGRNVVYWLSSWGTASKYLQAVSSLYWINNQLTEADMKVDAQYYTFYVTTPNSTMDLHLESLLVHELGHFLGLKHVGYTVPSVMWEVLDQNSVRDLPSADDKAHLQCEYN